MLLAPRHWVWSFEFGDHHALLVLDTDHCAAYSKAYGWCVTQFDTLIDHDERAETPFNDDFVFFV